MPTVLTTRAAEGSTYVINVAFTDAAGTAVTPTSVTWSLKDSAGNVINSRNGVSVTPASSIDIVLSGADLAVAGDDRSRVLRVDAVYNSDEGNGLTLVDFARFDVVDVS